MGPMLALAPALAGAAGASTMTTTLLSLAGAGMGLIGSMNEAAGMESEGLAQQANLKHQADQMKVNAGQERASSQRGAIEETRRKDLVRSAAIAKSAAGGGDQLDVLPQLAGIEDEGEFRKLTALYQGEDAARGLESGASGKVWEGDVAYKAAKDRAKSTRRSAYGKALMSVAGTVGGNVSKGFATKYNPSTGSAGASSSYFPNSGETVQWR